MKVVNLTIELDSDEEVLRFEQWIKGYVNLRDLQILPDTTELYKDDSVFRKLASNYKKARSAKNEYIYNKLRKWNT